MKGVDVRDLQEQQDQVVESEMEGAGWPRRMEAGASKPNRGFMRGGRAPTEQGLGALGAGRKDDQEPRATKSVGVVKSWEGSNRGGRESLRSKELGKRRLRSGGGGRA